ncbi:MAG TPA: transglutaminase family protein, partial [Solirubrobacteraceae bacterium]
MSIRLAIEHRTVYRYERPVRLGPHVVRLRPAPHCRTPILSYSLRVTPDEHFVNWQQDPFGNHLARLVFPKPTSELAVTVSLLADMTVINPFDFFVDEAAREWPFAYEESLAHDLAPCLARDAGGPLLDAWVAAVPRAPTPVISFLVELNRRVRDDVAYSVRMEPGVLTPDETLERALGSCRDSAWLLVHVLRRLGIAARFASGYLVQVAVDEQARPQADADKARTDSVDLHAWAEAYIPGAGWVGLDPTSGLLTGEGHIPLASTSVPAAAMPITGTTAPAQSTLDYSNVVRRIHEQARVTAPYTAEQWERIDALGHAVDAELEAGDARLTMGGEPTFVSATDVEAPEWNTAAVGGKKEALARTLAERLAADFAPGALLHHGQGKWYPGEPLPRWQIGVHWRADGRPLWREPELLADPTTPGSATDDDAALLAQAIADALGLPEELRYRAYEDPVGRLWTEARLPGGDPPQAPGPDPTGAGLALPDARAGIIADLDSGRGEPRGWALPVHRSPGDPGWSTGRWRLRRGHLFLIPGDSPVGLRLPLDALTWTPPPGDPALSLFRPVVELPESSSVAPAKVTEPPPVTALCVELRDGHVHVFLPPVADFGHAVELIEVVENAAATTGVQVVVEGYPPPADTRGRHFVVAPDPGVIEVNIHPSATWSELAGRTAKIVEEARALHLVTEKFRLDGTHTGTGGGSHLTLGGPTPADSPLLRRPDLLRSLLTYWQHHPSLSYLFSGRFVGPTSQSPRIDEGRHESLYELEIAFAELERLSADGPAPPWQVDRLFRNLLTDLTGNTHRAEFCIDKLFNPAAEQGRLGVIELRGFEMPPHPQMALVQALLVRALLARFWAEPYAAPLVRWGTELHDRFLLPWWVALDIRSVVTDLARHGFAFEEAWLEPFLEFRFPLLGVVDVEGISLELRTAIEPWNVLGEELAATTSRFVDSSMERLQVRLDGAAPSRYAVTCNGFPVPIQPTGTPGTYVGGVRYRAWQPPSTLHPTIGVHTP